MRRLNTYKGTGFFASIFTQANPKTVYESIIQNDMDDSSFSDASESLIKAITLPRHAFGGWQQDVLANSEAACKVAFNNFPFSYCNSYFNLL